MIIRARRVPVALRGRRVPGARLVAGGAALACAAMLAACDGSSSSPVADPPTVSGTAVSSASPAPSGPAPSGPATPAGAAMTPPPGVAGFWSGYGPCPHLGVKLGLSEHDPGVAYQVIEFTNRGSATCIIDGYPGVSLAAGTSPLGLPAAHNSAVPPKPVTLTHGGVANALLQITDAQHYAQGSCEPVRTRYLIVYLPNGTGPVKLSYAATACAKRLSTMQINAVRLGTGG